MEDFLRGEGRGGEGRGGGMVDGWIEDGLECGGCFASDRCGIQSIFDCITGPLAALQLQFFH